MLSYSLPTLDGDADSGDFLPSVCEARVSTNRKKSEQKDYHVRDQPGLHCEDPVLREEEGEKRDRHREMRICSCQSSAHRFMFLSKLGKKQQHMSSCFKLLYIRAKH